MSEVMAIEKITGEYLRFLGYFVEYRVPFKLNSGANSDIDILAYNPCSKKTILVECKAWGSPEKYISYSYKNLSKLFEDSLFKYNKFLTSESNKWGIKDIDEYWFIIPGDFDDDDKLPSKVKVIPIHSLLINILTQVKKDKNIRRKRYSDSALEFSRWLLRAYENKKIDLIDVELALSNSKQSYELVREKYLLNMMKLVKFNSGKRNANIDTRFMTLKLLSMIDKSNISNLVKLSQKQNINLNYNRIRVGLTTWLDSGIVSNDGEEYYILEAFKKLVKKNI